MRIGELAERTGTSPRVLRHYEATGLIEAQRCANGYRDFDERLVDRVLQIRGLLAAGLPTRLIAKVLPSLDGARVSVCPDDATPEFVGALEDELARMSRRMDDLARNRDAIAAYLFGLRATGRVRGRSTQVDEGPALSGDGAAAAIPPGSATGLRLS